MKEKLNVFNNAKDAANNATPACIKEINAVNFFKSLQNINFIPVFVKGFNAKSPAIKSWKELQTRKQERNEKIQYYEIFYRSDIKSYGKLNKFGVALITGSINSLEVIDIDNKAGDQKETDKYLLKILYFLKQKNIDLYIEKTPRGGYHILFLSEKPSKSQKLYCNDKVLIETKGEGGYIITAPTPGYLPLESNTKEGIYMTQLNDNLRDELFNYIRDFKLEDIEGFDDIKQREKTLNLIQLKNEKPNYVYDFDSFNQDEGNFLYAKNLIERLGWTIYDENDEFIDYTRPGKPSNQKKVSGGFHKKLKYFYVFTTNAAPLEAYKGYSLFNLICLLEYDNDTKKACKDLYAKGMLKKISDSTFTKSARDIISESLASVVDENKKKEMSQALDNKIIDVFFLKNKKLYIDNIKFKKYLADNGFFAKKVEGVNKVKNYYLIRVKNNVCEIIKEIELKQFLIKEIEKLPDSLNAGLITKVDLANYIVEKIDYKKFLDFIEVDDREFITDDKEHIYLFYRNCFIEITSDKIKIKDYEELDKLVWANKVLDRDFYYIEDEGSFLESFDNFYFADFLYRVFNNEEPTEKKNLFNYINEFKKSVGYLIHTYKDPTSSKAILFYDDITEKNYDGEAQGRTGKTLLSKEFLKHYRNVCVEDGRNFNFRENRFAFQNVDIDTDIIIIDDIRKDFDISRLYSVITTGITIEKKRMAPIKLDLKDTPKIILSANYAIKLNDESSKARVFDVCFKNYFTSEKTPIDLYQRAFFYDFTEDEWNLLDNFTVRCCQYHLRTTFTFMQKMRKKNYLYEISKITAPRDVKNFIIAYLMKYTKNEDDIVEIKPKILSEIFKSSFNKEARPESISKALIKILSVFEFSYEKTRGANYTTFVIRADKEKLEAFRDVLAVTQLIDEINAYYDARPLKTLNN